MEFDENDKLFNVVSGKFYHILEDAIKLIWWRMMHRRPIVPRAKPLPSVVFPRWSGFWWQ